MKIEDQTLIDQYYDALVSKDKQYEGIFYAAIHTTHIFCHATCPARKPKKKNVTFYTLVDDCLQAGYKPCKICHPLDDPGKATHIIDYLVQEVLARPFDHWGEQTLKSLGIHPNTARRHFKNNYNMTFKQFVLQTRLSLGVSEQGKLITKQVASGYESQSGFSYALKKVLNKSPKDIDQVHIVGLQVIDTVIGPMVAISDDDYLYFLGFKSCVDLDKRINAVLDDSTCLIVKETQLSRRIKDQIDAYFRGELKTFDLPYKIKSSNEQILNEIKKIPYGTTLSYKQLGIKLSKHPRTIGQANASNPLALIIPCHRLVGVDGDLKHYAGGVQKKQYLIQFEHDHL